MPVLIKPLSQFEFTGLPFAVKFATASVIVAVRLLREHSPWHAAPPPPPPPATALAPLHFHRLPRRQAPCHSLSALPASAALLSLIPTYSPPRRPPSASGHYLGDLQFFSQPPKSSRAPKKTSFSNSIDASSLFY